MQDEITAKRERRHARHAARKLEARGTTPIAAFFGAREIGLKRYTALEGPAPRHNEQPIDNVEAAVFLRRQHRDWADGDAFSVIEARSESKAARELAEAEEARLEAIRLAREASSAFKRRGVHSGKEYSDVESESSDDEEAGF